MPPQKQDPNAKSRGPISFDIPDAPKENKDEGRVPDVIQHLAAMTARVGGQIAGSMGGTALGALLGGGGGALGGGAVGGPGGAAIGAVGGSVPGALAGEVLGGAAGSGIGDVIGQLIEPGPHNIASESLPEALKHVRWGQAGLETALGAVPGSKVVQGGKRLASLARGAALQGVGVEGRRALNDESLNPLDWSKGEAASVVGGGLLSAGLAHLTGAHGASPTTPPKSPAAEPTIPREHWVPSDNSPPKFDVTTPQGYLQKLLNQEKFPWTADEVTAHNSAREAAEKAKDKGFREADARYAEIDADRRGAEVESRKAGESQAKQAGALDKDQWDAHREAEARRVALAKANEKASAQAAAKAEKAAATLDKDQWQAHKDAYAARQQAIADEQAATKLADMKARVNPEGRTTVTDSVKSGDETGRTVYREPEPDAGEGGDSGGDGGDAPNGQINRTGSDVPKGPQGSGGHVLAGPKGQALLDEGLPPTTPPGAPTGAVPPVAPPVAPPQPRIYTDADYNRLSAITGIPANKIPSLLNNSPELQARTMAITRNANPNAAQRLDHLWALEHAEREAGAAVGAAVGAPSGGAPPSEPPAPALVPVTPRPPAPPAPAGAVVEPPVAPPVEPRPATPSPVQPPIQPPTQAGKGYPEWKARFDELSAKWRAKVKAGEPNIDEGYSQDLRKLLEDFASEEAPEATPAPPKAPEPTVALPETLPKSAAPPTPTISEETPLGLNFSQRASYAEAFNQHWQDRLNNPDVPNVADLYREARKKLMNDWRSEDVGGQGPKGPDGSAPKRPGQAGYVNPPVAPLVKPASGRAPGGQGTPAHLQISEGQKEVARQLIQPEGGVVPADALRKTSPVALAETHYRDVAEGVRSGEVPTVDSPEHARVYPEPTRQTSHQPDRVAGKGLATLRKNPKERGEIAPGLAKYGINAVTGLGGAAYGYSQDGTPSDKIANALMYGAAGAAAPSVIEHLMTSRSAPRPAGVPGPTAFEALQSRVNQALPNIVRGNLLSEPYGLIANTIVGPPVGGFIGAVEMMAKGVPGAKGAVLELANYPKVLARIRANFPRAMAKLQEVNRVEGSAPANASAIEKLWSTPGQAMTAADMAVKDILLEHKIPEELAQKITLTAEVKAAFTKMIVNFNKQKPSSTLGSLMLPFKRTAANILESGVERTPGVGVLFDKMRGIEDRRIGKGKGQEVLVEQLMGTAVSTVGYMVGLNTPVDPVTSRLVLKMGSNASGMYSVPFSVGFMMAQGHRKGATGLADQLSNGVKEISYSLPLPTLRGPQDMVDSAKNLVTTGQAHPGASGPERYLPDMAIPGPFRKTFRDTTSMLHKNIMGKTSQDPIFLFDDEK